MCAYEGVWVLIEQKKTWQFKHLLKRMSKTFPTQVTSREAGGSLVVVLTGGNVTPTELTELEAQIGK